MVPNNTMECIHKEVFGAGFFVGSLLSGWAFIIFEILFSERSINERGLRNK